jgi:hypothetical protein
MAEHLETRANMVSTNHGTNQHFVSRLLLRPFETDTFRGRRVWVLDKETMRISDLPIKSIASEQGFYDAESTSLDGFVTKIENDLGQVLYRVRRTDTLVDLDDKSQRILSLGMATQFIRTKRMRMLIEQSAAGTLKLETAQWFAEEYGNLSPRHVQLDWLSQWVFSLARFFFTKTWVILKPIGEIQFITSDNPVIIRTPEGRNPSDVLELGTLYLPIASQLTIAFLSRQTAVSVDESIRRGGLQKQIPAANASVDEAEAQLINRLQLQNAEHYAISNRKDLLVAAQVNDIVRV